MNSYHVYTKEDGPITAHLIKADGYRFIREKGGFVRYEFFIGGETVATISADFVNAIIKTN